ncbi:hypothetical protein BJP44_04050 [Candidatus Williamhamiltonella defendens]|nr:hypothetical protein BJP44_04050 [Candidatus Hamiltonella defensa]
MPVLNQPANAQARQCLHVCQTYAETEHWPARFAQGGGWVLCGRLARGKIIWPSNMVCTEGRS